VSAHQGEREHRVERGASGINRSARGRRLVFRVGERQLRLNDFEPRDAAGIEPCLRRVASALSQHLHVGEECEPVLRDHSRDECAPQVRLHFGDRHIQFRVASSDHRISDGNAACSFATQFQWHGEGVTLLGRFLRRFNPNLWIQALGGDVA
jgi:hypothetical protein